MTTYEVAAAALKRAFPELSMDPNFYRRIAIVALEAVQS